MYGVFMGGGGGFPFHGGGGHPRFHGGGGIDPYMTVAEARAGIASGALAPSMFDLGGEFERSMIYSGLGHPAMQAYHPDIPSHFFPSAHSQSSPGQRRVSIDTEPEEVTGVYVKNVNGTSQDRYRIRGLYQKYLEAGGREVETCQCVGCSAPSTATAHVIRTDRGVSNEWYLTRTCAQHNHHSNTDAYRLRSNAKLIKVTDITHA